MIGRQLTYLRSLVRQQPIKVKLQLIILLSTIAALVFEGVGFLVYERVRTRDDLTRDLASLARVVADREFVDGVGNAEADEQAGTYGSGEYSACDMGDEQLARTAG